MSHRLMTLGKTAIALHCAEYHLRKLADNKVIPCVKVGWYRLFEVAHFPRIRRALALAGYITEAVEVTAGA